MGRFCSNCGEKVLDGQKFCAQCGMEAKTNLENVNSDAGFSQAESAKQRNAQDKKQSLTGIVAAVCGILSIILCLVPVAGLIVGIVAVILGQIGLSKKQEYKTGMALEGVITGIIGVLLGLIPISVKYMYIIRFFK